MEKSYYAIIPADVRYTDIPANAKLLYGEITALCNEKGYCWANNQYFSKLYGVTKETVSGWISILNKNGFIHYVIDPKEGNKRKIYLATPIKKNRKRSYEKDEDPLKENLNHNNTINNTSNKDEQSSSLTSDTLPHTLQDNHVSGEKQATKTADLTKQANNVITYFQVTYKYNSKRDYIITSRAKYIKNLKKTLKLVDEWTLKKLIDIYLSTDDKFWEQSEWSLDVFIMDITINKLMRIYGK